MTTGRSSSPTATVEILDIAFPPDQQLEIIREAVKHRHIKGILAQKPLAMNYRAGPRGRGRLQKGRRQARGELEHALRPVDQGLEDHPAARLPRRTRAGHHRHARHPPLAVLPRRVRPADASEHEHPSHRCVPLPVRRSREGHCERRARTRARSSSTPTASPCTSSNIPAACGR